MGTQRSGLVVAVLAMALVWGALGDGPQDFAAQLVDDSRLIGRPTTATLTLSTRLGELQVPYEVVLQILALPKGELEVTLVNGDCLIGRPTQAAFGLSWALGDCQVPFVHLAMLSRLDTPLHRYLVHGIQVDDRLPTAFVKDVPEEVARRLRRETRRVNTMGPQVDRHRTAPWLYPVAGKGEAPQVFEENGHRYYPIWGTWIIHNSGGPARCDENRMPLEGALIDHHTHTTIDFFVVEIAVPAARTVPPASPPTPITEE